MAERIIVQAPSTQIERLVSELCGRVPLMDFLGAVTEAGLAVQSTPEGDIKLVPVMDFLGAVTEAGLALQSTPEGDIKLVPAAMAGGR